VYSRCTHIIFLWNIYGDFGLLSTFILIYVCFIYSKNRTWKDAFQLETLRLDDTNTVTQPDCQPHKWAEKYHSARKRTIYTKIDIKKEHIEINRQTQGQSEGNKPVDGSATEWRPLGLELDNSIMKYVVIRLGSLVSQWPAHTHNTVQCYRTTMTIYTGKHSLAVTA